MWIEAGQSPATFWTETPKIIVLTIKANSKRIRGEYNRQVAITWLGASFQRSKNFPPKPDKFYAREYQPKRQQTSDEMLAIVRGMQSYFSNIKGKK